MVRDGSGSNAAASALTVKADAACADGRRGPDGLLGEGDGAGDRILAAEDGAGLIDAFFRFFSAGEFDDSPVVDTVHRVTGRPPRAFGQWAGAHAHLFTGG